MRRGSLRLCKLALCGVLAIGADRRRPVQSLADSVQKLTPVNCSHFNPSPAGGPPPYTGLRRTPPRSAGPPETTFFVFFRKRVFQMRLLSTCVLERFRRQHATKTLPKRSPNRPKIQPKMLQNPMLCCDSRKLNPSKPSHTFAHFCCFQTLKNRPEIAQKTSSNSDLSWTAFENPKNTIPELFKLAFGSQLGPNLALSWFKSRLK